VHHPGFDATTKRRDRRLAVAAVEIPGALPDHGYVGAAGAEFFLIHGLPQFGAPQFVTDRPWPCNRFSCAEPQQRAAQAGRNQRNGKPSKEFPEDFVNDFVAPSPDRNFEFGADCKATGSPGSLTALGHLTEELIKRHTFVRL
jgi:hypothetical protein